MQGRFIFIDKVDRLVINKVDRLALQEVDIRCTSFYPGVRNALVGGMHDNSLDSQSVLTKEGNQKYLV